MRQIITASFILSKFRNFIYTFIPSLSKVWNTQQVVKPKYVEY